LTLGGLFICFLLRDDDDWFKLSASILIFSLVLHGFGQVFRLYAYISWFDKVTHFLAGFAISSIIMGISIPFLFEKIKFESITNKKILVSIIAVALFNIGYEVYELILFNLIVDSPYLNAHLIDMIIDVVVVEVGGFLIIGLYLLYEKYLKRKSTKFWQ
jgi:hypothetical protein